MDIPECGCAVPVGIVTITDLEGVVIDRIALCPCCLEETARVADLTLPLSMREQE